MYGCEDMVLDYLRAAARGATIGNTATFYLGGADRPVFLQLPPRALATRYELISLVSFQCREGACGAQEWARSRRTQNRNDD